jgi:hypothetical protein
MDYARTPDYRVHAPSSDVFGLLEGSNTTAVQGDTFFFREL